MKKKVDGPADGWLYECLHSDSPNLEVGFSQMAFDHARETEATIWAEATLGDVADEAR